MERPITRLDLTFKAVHIQCLDVHGEEINGAYGTGFIVREDDRDFLYTAWHLVTSFNMHDLQIGQSLPNRMSIRILLQDAHGIGGPVVSIGGSQSIIIPLYEGTSPSYLPLWYQDREDEPQADLNAIGIRVPKIHDVIKIPIPNGVRVSDIQVIDKAHCFLYGSSVGDRVYIVGYPYGYSPLGMGQPTPVVLTRHVAATHIEGQHMHVLLDGAGAPGMSGGPVFVENREGRSYLAGIYTGAIYPNRNLGLPDGAVTLGIYCNLIITWNVSPLEPCIHNQ